MLYEILFSIIVLLMLFVGFLQILYPEKAYMFGKRWFYNRQAGLSEAGVFIIRISGIVIVGFCIYILVSILSALIG